MRIFPWICRLPGVVAVLVVDAFDDFAFAVVLVVFLTVAPFVFALLDLLATVWEVCG
jgi:hypothetical protein